jgi:hypothetical protein
MGLQGLHRKRSNPSWELTLAIPFNMRLSSLPNFATTRWSLEKGGDLPTSWNTVVQTDDAVARMENAGRHAGASSGIR